MSAMEAPPSDEAAKAAGLGAALLEEGVTLRLQMRAAVRGVLFAFGRDDSEETEEE